MRGAISAVVSEGRFLAGAACMALSFFSLLFSLSHADVSLIARAVDIACDARLLAAEVRSTRGEKPYLRG